MWACGLGSGSSRADTRIPPRGGCTTLWSRSDRQERTGKSKLSAGRCEPFEWGALHGDCAKVSAQVSEVGNWAADNERRKVRDCSWQPETRAAKPSHCAKSVIALGGRTFAAPEPNGGRPNPPLHTRGATTVSALQRQVTEASKDHRTLRRVAPSSASSRRIGTWRSDQRSKLAERYPSFLGIGYLDLA